VRRTITVAGLPSSPATGALPASETGRRAACHAPCSGRTVPMPAGATQRDSRWPGGLAAPRRPRSSPAHRPGPCGGGPAGLRGADGRGAAPMATVPGGAARRGSGGIAPRPLRQRATALTARSREGRPDVGSLLASGDAHRATLDGPARGVAGVGPVSGVKPDD